MNVSYEDDLETVAATMRRLAASIRAGEVDPVLAMGDAMGALDAVGYGWPSSAVQQELVGDAHLALLFHLWSLGHAIRAASIAAFFDLTIGALVEDVALTLERIGVGLDQRAYAMRTIPGGR